MSNEKKTPTRVSDHALEMIMRDVLDGMLELSLEMSMTKRSLEFEIVEIGQNKPNVGRIDRAGGEGQPAAILPFPKMRRAAC